MCQLATQLLFPPLVITVILQHNTELRSSVFHTLPLVPVKV